MPNAKLPLLLATLAIASAATWALFASHKSLADGGHARNAPPEDRLAAAIEDLAKGQREMQWRLERLERARPARSGPGLGDTPGRAGSGADNQPPAATSRRVTLDAAIRENDEKFRSEPTAGRWSQQTEQDIYAALAPSALAEAKIPAPHSADASCRSNTCRIELGYPDETASEQANVYLLQAISAALPTALTFYKPNPDGTTTVLVYAQR